MTGSSDRGTVMSDRPDAIARFTWALRHSWRLAAAAFVVMLAAVVGAGYLLTGAPIYSAQALVVPRILGEDLDSLRLSRFQQAVFDGGGVVEAALESPEVPYTDRAQLLEHVRLAPVADNIALNVVADDEAPEVAAEVANVVADELVDALNRVGSSAGVFFVHTAATPSTDPEPRIGIDVLAIIGLLGGVSASAGLVGAVNALRRPILAPDDAVDLLGEPALGRLRLPKGRGAIDPKSVLGLSALLGRLYPDSSSICAFVASKGSQSAKLHVTGLVARALARRDTVMYVASGSGEHVTEELLHPRIALRTSSEVDPHQWGTAPTVIEGPSHSGGDLPQCLPGDAAVVVVVAEGTPASGIERLAEQFQPGEIRGVLFVQYEHRRRSGHASAAYVQSHDTAALRHG